ncbi:MAG: RNA polymerase factor sigma-32 [Inquilinaceae bacterium]
MSALSHRAEASGSSWTRYVRAVHRYPMLDEDEEIDLAKRWRDHRDIDAAHRLVNSHLRFVTTIALRYRRYSLPREELVAEGNVGLLKAVDRFDPTRGSRFAQYAAWWIRSTIQEYVHASRSMVKMGTSQSRKRLFYNLNHVKAKLGIVGGGELSPEMVAVIAARLAVSEHDVIYMNGRLAAPDHSLNQLVGPDGGVEFGDLLVDETQNQEMRLAERDEFDRRRDFLGQAMTGLTDRERHIFTARRLTDPVMTLQELSDHHGVSRERIRQIEYAVYGKVAKRVREACERASLRPGDVGRFQAGPMPALPIGP